MRETARAARALFVVAVLAATLSTAAANPDQDWRAIEALDAGPRSNPASREEALLLARNHFLLQRRALEDFLKKYPSDARAPSARLRLAEIHATEGMMDRDRRRVQSALALMAEVEDNSSTPDKIRSDAAFRSASIYMQAAPGGPDQAHTQVVAAARAFVRKFPTDIRGPRLLVEAATVCDSVPETKRQLLLEARAATTEEPLLLRIADDLTRLDLLDKPLEFEIPTLDGKSFSLASLRGQPVILIFWAVESPQSLLWLRDFRSDYARLKDPPFEVVTINLDRDRAVARERAQALDAPWPVGFEGAGWESPLPRKFGINALPTVWAIDRAGVLRSLDAKHAAIQWGQRLAEN